MRYILALLLALLGGCYQYGPPQSPAYDSHAWVNWLSSGTHQIYADCGDEGTSSGSGVVVTRRDDTTFFATAFHVVDPLGCTYTVDGEELEVVAYDEYYDQAILVGDIPGRIADPADDVFVGMRVTQVGYPLQPFTSRTGFQVSHGGLTAFVGRMYKTDADAYYGSSGGPCFDKDGDLVGLVVMMRTAPPFEWYVTPSWRTYELLDEAYEALR